MNDYAINYPSFDSNTSGFSTVSNDLSTALLDGQGNSEQSIKKKKNKRISFKDDVEIVDIESYKEFNADVTIARSSGCFKCKLCVIF
jgi:hypothetical protein